MLRFDENEGENKREMRQGIGSTASVIAKNDWKNHGPKARQNKLPPDAKIIGRNDRDVEQQHSKEVAVLSLRERKIHGHLLEQPHDRVGKESIVVGQRLGYTDATVDHRILNEELPIQIEP